MSKNKLDKKCITCGKSIIDNNKSGYCNIHRDRTGSNNSFYKKHHSKETIDAIKAKTKIASKNNWKNPNYREKVIKGVSKPRKATFKQEQSERITKWYQENPEQRGIRSNRMKNSWDTGKIAYSPKIRVNRSKIEKDFLCSLQGKINCKGRETIHIGTKWFFPDIFLGKERIIIEFYGNYYHANPRKYRANDVVRAGLTAQEIWDLDKERISRLEKEGYYVIVIWEDDYKTNKNGIIQSLANFIDNESCAF